LRLVNGAIAALCVISGGFVSPFPLTLKTLFASISILFLTLGGNVINDYFDRDVDKINRPERWIPSGKMRAKDMLLLSILLFFIGLVSAYLSGVIIFFIDLFIVTFLILYTPFFKPCPLVGNVVVAFLAALVFPIGALSTGSIKGSIFPFIFAFLFQFSRELAKDIEDIPGDIKVKMRTFPILFGEKNAEKIILLSLYLLFFTTLASIFFYPVIFRIAMILLVDIPLIFVIILIYRKLEWSKLQRLLKILMISGLIAITTGGIR